MLKRKDAYFYEWVDIHEKFKHLSTGTVKKLAPNLINKHEKKNFYSS